MATILQILQGFCYRNNLPAPASFVGATTPTELQLLSLLKYVGDDLRGRPVKWPQLKRTYTFTTSTGVSRYQLPGDFHTLLESTQWDESNHWPMRGPISDYNMAIRQYAVVSLQTRKAYRIVGPVGYRYTSTQASAGTIEIDPAGGNDTDTLVLQYLSRNWIWPQAWLTNTAYTIGDVRSGDGYVYQATTSGTSGATRPDWSTGTDSDGVVSWKIYTEPYNCTTFNPYLTDNDICLFDDDLMIQGLLWTYLRAKGLEYQQERKDWENMVKSAVSRFNGPTRINMADSMEDMFDWPNIPAGSWDV